MKGHKTKTKTKTKTKLKTKAKISKKKLRIAIKFYQLKISRINRDPSLFYFPIQSNFINYGVKKRLILKKNIKFRSKFKRRSFKVKHKSKYVLNLCSLGLRKLRKKN